MTIASDQAEHIISTILETIANDSAIRQKILSEIHLSDSQFIEFAENVCVRCDDVYS